MFWAIKGFSACGGSPSAEIVFRVSYIRSGLSLSTVMINYTLAAEMKCLPDNFHAYNHTDRTTSLVQRTVNILSAYITLY